MKFLTLSFVIFASINACNADACMRVKGVDIYCNPVGTMYPGGTPLYDEVTGVSLTKMEYLDLKGLNEYCDPIGTMYTGGTPLFNEGTGRMMTLESYLKRKVVCI